MLVAVIALGAVAATRLRHPAAAWAAAPVVVAGMFFPLVALLLAGAGLALVRARRVRRKRVARASASRDAVALAELTALGLTSGLSFAAALQAAGDEVGDPLHGEVQRVLRSGRHRGIAPALEQAGGAAQRLYLLAARATITGAPVADAVRAYVAEQRDVQRAHALAAARRLPVQLLFPMALLVLPGFMVLTVGPALLGALGRLGL